MDGSVTEEEPQISGLKVEATVRYSVPGISQPLGSRKRDVRRSLGTK